jgi:RNA polymerase sigma-70 factor (ECF subfamily)
MTGSQEAALDAVQEAWLSGWKGIRSFRGEAEFYSWMRRILVNGINNEFRKRSRRAALVSLDRSMDSEESGEPLQVEDEGADPQDIVGRAETAREIGQAVVRLPDIYRVVFLLRETELMSYSEIADVLGIAEGTVKSRLNMARRMLRETLSEEVGSARFA